MVAIQECEESPIAVEYLVRERQEILELLERLTQGSHVTLDELPERITRRNSVLVMVGRGSRTEPGLQMRGERRFEQMRRITIGERIRQVLLPLGPVEYLASAEWLFKRLLGRVDAEKTDGAGADEMRTGSVSIRHGFGERLHRSVGLAPHTRDRPRASIAQHEEDFSHVIPSRVKPPDCSPYDVRRAS